MAGRALLMLAAGAAGASLLVLLLAGLGGGLWPALALAGVALVAGLALGWRDRD